MDQKYIDHIYKILSNKPISDDLLKLLIKEYKRLGLKLESKNKLSFKNVEEGINKFYSSQQNIDILPDEIAINIMISLPDTDFYNFYKSNKKNYNIYKNNIDYITEQRFLKNKDKILSLNDRDLYEFYKKNKNIYNKYKNYIKEKRNENNKYYYGKNIDIYEYYDGLHINDNINIKDNESQIETWQNEGDYKMVDNVYDYEAEIVKNLQFTDSRNFTLKSRFYSEMKRIHSVLDKILPKTLINTLDLETLDGLTKDGLKFVKNISIGAFLKKDFESLPDNLKFLSIKCLEDDTLAKKIKKRYPKLNFEYDFEC